MSDVSSKKTRRPRIEVSGQKIKLDRSKRTSTLVMLSGGIDSVYVLAKLLKETDDIVIAHHVHMVNDEGRFKAEAECCKKIVKWCRDNLRDFGYSESAIDHRGLFAMGFDIIAIGFEAGIINRCFEGKFGKAVDRWVTGWCAEEKAVPGRAPHIEAICAASSYPLSAPEYFHLPVIPKADQIRYLPDDLLDLCWTCRRPIWNEDGSFDECGICITCELMKDVRQELADTQ
ncbi:hypothetical protein NBZ79_11155 [Sneathiella marina]|uniref:Uncharacterized protein n=1 Tax=Sneathiella marina TaxID=2950108 RepID=A0ABY4VXU8_9PROT|nr:hypothetical protein [Sneathiella marina]USG59735.1 hypothetical protein NBZ79_11155 [Sneathiella marina]